ncbi:MAG TPA: hypothetical protein PK493_10540, partial [Pseudomonadota bacterium]|nr:hypothetical protein [Pseudomonadota bacterium]
TEQRDKLTQIKNAVVAMPHKRRDVGKNRHGRLPSSHAMQIVRVHGADFHHEAKFSDDSADFFAAAVTKQ